MKQAGTLATVVKELQAQHAIKRDFRADTRATTMTVRVNDLNNDGNNTPVLTFNGDTFTLRATAHKQLAARIGVPVSYYQRMLTEAPMLLSANVNHWLREAPDVLTLRTLGPVMRAVLGKQYRIIDHLELLNAMLPMVYAKYPDMTFDSVHLGEDRMYIKCLLPRLQRDVRVGDPVQAGVVITNSETGDTTLRIEPLILRLVCSNGMIVPDNAFKRRHVGVRANVAEGEAVEFKDDTIAADNQAIILKARDSMEHILKDDVFEATVQKMRDATERPVENPIPAVKEVTRMFDFDTKEMEGVMRHFLAENENTQYGLVNAITRHAQDVESYDRSVELEQVAHRVLTLPRGEWTQIARASDSKLG